MVKTSDCFFNVQTYSEGKTGRITKAAFRFGNDYIYYDPKSKTKVVKQHLSSATIYTEQATTKTWTNDRIGCSVSLTLKSGTLDTWVNVNVKCNNPLYTKYFGGYCGVHDITDKANNGPCGQEKMPWEATAKEVMWDKEFLFAIMKTCELNKCHEGPATSPPVSCKFTRRLRATTGSSSSSPLTSISADTKEFTRNAMASCEVLDAQTKVIAMEYCRRQVETAWWINDYNCLGDVCLDLKNRNTELNKSIGSSQPCEDTVVNKADIITIDGFDYTTLNPITHDEDGNLTSNYLTLPNGWTLCPDSSSNAAQNLFDAQAVNQCILTDTDHVGGVACDNDWNDQMLMKMDATYRKCYNVGIDAKVCIQRPTPTYEGTCEMVKTTWTVTVEGDDVGEVPMGSSSDKVADFLTSLTPSSTLGDVVAFATIAGAAHVCIAADASTEKKFEVLTTPSYGLSLVGQSIEDGTFYPAIRNDQFETTLKSSSNSKVNTGYCLGDLNLNSKMCIQIRSSSPLSLNNGKINIEAGKTITFCPRCTTV